MLFGCDFSSRPTARKPIVVAVGVLRGETVALESLELLPTIEALARWLQRYPRWIGGFDFPFGLPRELVLALGWPTQWLACMRHYSSLSRAQIRDRFAAFCDGREPGRKFAHRATDRWSGSSPSMKWVNPPVAYMLHAGVPLLIEAGAHLPGLFDGDGHTGAAHGGTMRVALEAYPGLLAREVLGGLSAPNPGFAWPPEGVPENLGAARRFLMSYKSDERARQTDERRQRRMRMIDALASGATRLALRLAVTPAQRNDLIEDARGDCLDAVLCLMQAAWGQRCGAPGFGLPLPIDPLEGWIVTVLPG